ncbi:hypothetical protein AWM75_05485 [Aerococcus urinaehominis]|uniref:Uncharacterized protein n=1 Tax=Aerococcus urinaehominis TaxID=128944 RepID=A0A0X8FLF8_9LACT|nr:alpha/beta hydrolase [Aerococcus urinaehominis]AMB99480.1 hypothetical protein AWM75_05485 [Aerococcus urinaehominis]SDM26974.1 alpha/beta hydrolase fold [Aerococcus urinaehominis]
MKSCDRAGYISRPDGSQIYFRQVGQGAPLVFLHGNGGSSRYFKHQVDTLSRYYQLIFMDSRGQGRSTNQQDYLDFNLMADDLAALLDYLAVKQVLLVGFSDGANLALMFSYRYPSRVRGQVLNAGNLKFAGLKWLDQALVALEVGLFRVLASFSTWAAANFEVSKLMTRDLPLSWADLTEIRVPSLVLIGSRDVVTYRHALAMTRFLDQGYLLAVSGQGHHFAQKQADLFNGLVLKFFKRTVDECGSQSSDQRGSFIYK